MTLKRCINSKWLGRGRRLLTLVMALTILLAMMPQSLAAVSVGSSSASLVDSTVKSFVQVPAAGANFFTGETSGTGTVVTVPAGSVWMLVTEDYYTVDSVNYYGVYYDNKVHHVRCQDVILMSTADVHAYIKNTIWGLIVPNLLMSGFLVMLVRNYFENSIPKDLYESARIDGASEFQTFFRIALPLSTPILATVGLMMGIAYWNDWQNGLYYISDKGKHLYTIQNILNNINENISYLAQNATVGTTIADLPTTTARMAIAVVGVLPILVIYPFFQKYFAKGITMGAVKG